MTLLRRRERAKRATPADPPPVYLDARAAFATRYLFGQGLEIGALHLPLAVPDHAQVRYVDRMTAEELRKEYPELADWDLTPVDVIDNGELLTAVPDGSQDFIIANHFLEHCENPIGTIKVHLGKLKPGGVLFYAVPDRRYTFDFRRPATGLEHMILDHEEGPERSRREHYEEWTRLVPDEESTRLVPGETQSEEWATRRARELETAGYSIHMHVWTQAEFLQLLLHCRQRFDDAFDIEAAARQALEFVVVLRKQGLPPAPKAPTSDGGVPEDVRIIELQEESKRLQRELQGLLSSPSWRITEPLRRAKRTLRNRRLLRKRR
jgi:SAM-dependent methyltransferase